MDSIDLRDSMGLVRYSEPRLGMLRSALAAGRLVRGLLLGPCSVLRWCASSALAILSPHSPHSARPPEAEATDDLRRAEDRLDTEADLLLELVLVLSWLVLELVSMMTMSSSSALVWVVSRLLLEAGGRLVSSVSSQ